jgi:5-hydroxyisourate hydrolase-like protein (transthyretin family)
VAKGSISGIVLQSASGNPLPNVRVTVARTDVPESFTKLARQLIGGPLEGGPRGEVTVPGEFLESMKAEISAELASMKAMQEAGRPQIPGFPPGFSPEDLPPGVSPEEFFGIDPGDFSPEELFGFPPEMAGIADLDLDGVQSLTLDASGKLSMILKSAPPLMTDGSGKFEFRDLDAGTYRLTFVANGYVRQDFGQTGLGGGTPVLLEPGKNLDNLVTRMTQTGVITGRILNTQGKPLAGVPVQLARFAYDASGKKKALPVLSVQTNDRGEYRFYYVMPGRYLVSAGTTGATPGGGYGGYGGYGYGGYADYAALAAYYGYAMGLPGAVPSQNRILDQRFVPAYYPGTPDVNSASPVELAAGGAVSDINLMLASQGSFVVRGRVVDPTGGAPQNASIRLTPQDGNIVPVRGGPNYNQTDGTFEMRDVPNGSYLLIVEMQNRVVQPPRPTGPRNPAEQAEYNIAMQNAQAESRLRAAIPVVVDNRDVNDIVASPAPGGFFNGKVRVEGAGAGKPAAGKPAVQVNRLISEFRPAGSDGTPTTKPGLQPQSPQPRADGTFRVNSVYAGDYWFRIRQLPEGYYIKSARIGETDVLNHAVTLPMSDANLALDIVVSPNVG